MGAVSCQVVVVSSCQVVVVLKEARAEKNHSREKLDSWFRVDLADDYTRPGLGWPMSAAVRRSGRCPPRALEEGPSVAVASISHSVYVCGCRGQVGIII